MLVEVVYGAAAVAPENAGSMRIVNHEDGAEFFREVAQRRQRTNVAIHAEDAVGDQQLAAGLVFHRSKLLFGVRNIFMAEHQYLGARQPGAINDAGMVQLVRDDEILFAENRRNRARVRGKPGLKHHARFHVLELRDLLL